MALVAKSERLDIAAPGAKTKCLDIEALQQSERLDIVPLGAKTKCANVAAWGPSQYV